MYGLLKLTIKNDHLSYGQILASKISLRFFGFVFHPLYLANTAYVLAMLRMGLAFVTSTHGVL